MKKNNYFLKGLFRIILSAFFMLSFSMVSAQTSKGLWMVGGNLGFNRYEDYTSFSINPNAGYLFTDHLGAGLGLGFSGYFSEGGSTLFTGINPFGKYYFGSGKTQPFLSASAGYNYRRYKYDSDYTNWNYDSSDWNFSWNVAAGVSYFLNKNAAIEGIIGYSGNIYISFGFQIFLGTGKD